MEVYQPSNYSNVSLWFIFRVVALVKVVNTFFKWHFVIIIFFLNSDSLSRLPLFEHLNSVFSVLHINNTQLIRRKELKKYLQKHCMIIFQQCKLILQWNKFFLIKNCYVLHLACIIHQWSVFLIVNIVDITQFQFAAWKST